MNFLKFIFSNTVEICFISMIDIQWILCRCILLYFTNNIVSYSSYCFFVESPAPLKVVLDVSYAAYVKGDQTGFEIDPLAGVEASELYPDLEYTTVDQYLNR